MARLSDAAVGARLAALALALTGCPDQHEAAPPPAESFEIASAAPGALGALAGGTDAAVGAPVGDPDSLDPDEPGDGPPPPDAGPSGAPAPASGAEGVPL